MSGRPQHIRVKTGPSVASLVVGGLVQVAVLAFTFAVAMLRAAAVVTWWLIVNVVVPGVRRAAQAAARLAANIAGRVAAKRGEWS